MMEGIVPITMVRCTGRGECVRIARWADYFPARVSAQRSADHGAVHGARGSRHHCAMQNEGGQRSTIAARGRFPVEGLPSGPTTARLAESHIQSRRIPLIPLYPAQSHISHLIPLIPLNPGVSRLNFLFRVPRPWRGPVSAIPAHPSGLRGLPPSRACVSSAMT